MVELYGVAEKLAQLLVDLTNKAIIDGAPLLGYTDIYRTDDDQFIVSYSTDTEGNLQAREKFEQIIDQIGNSGAGADTNLWILIKESFALYEYTVTVGGRPTYPLGGAYYSVGYIQFRDAIKGNEELTEEDAVNLVKERLRYRAGDLKDTLVHECLHFLLDITGKVGAEFGAREAEYHKDKSEIFAHFLSILGKYRWVKEYHEELTNAIKEGRLKEKKVRRVMSALFHFLVSYIKNRIPKDPDTNRWLRPPEIVDTAYYWAKVLWGEEVQNELYRIYLSARSKAIL